MRAHRRLTFGGAAVVSLFLVVGSALAAGAIVVDRGLPTSNLNNAAGANRSNVSWAFGSDWISGDDFAVGSAGETWVITHVRTWSTSGVPGSANLGDRFQSVSLYGGPASIYLPMTPLATGTLTVGSSTNSNANITHTPVTYAGGADYQGSSGSYIQIWQHDFNGLSWIVPGGTPQVFGVDGELQPSVTYYWFNHASNAALSGSPQQGSDDQMWYWAKDGSDSGQWSSDGFGWDKASDINIEVFASQVATNGNACKKGGWQSLARADGSTFKNQGDCMQYVNTGK